MRIFACVAIFTVLLITKSRPDNICLGNFLGVSFPEAKPSKAWAVHLALIFPTQTERLQKTLPNQFLNPTLSWTVSTLGDKLSHVSSIAMNLTRTGNMQIYSLSYLVTAHENVQRTFYERVQTTECDREVYDGAATYEWQLR